MGKQRVYEVAKENNLSSKEMMILLDKLGIEVKSHMSNLEDDQIQKLCEHLEKLQQPDEDTRPVEKEKNKPSRRRKKTKEVSAESHKPAQSKQQPHKTKKSNKKKEEKDDKPEAITIAQEITVGEVAEKMRVKATELIKKMMKLGIMANVNQKIDFDTASIVCAEFDIQVVTEEQGQDDSDIDEDIKEIEDAPEKLRERAPVITVMGHVDHGKTSLLDVIRKTNVTEKEAGGITQHIGAYQVNLEDKKITFLDTPGHAAFTSMRARGAEVTDIAILVVAADDGIMPQTIEAIDHAKSANVPIVVAINKIDKPEANPDKVKQQLTEHELVPEEWGGSTICVPVSALKKEGIDNLLEMVLLVAEMEELKANSDRNADGIVIEAELDKGRGPVATILVKRGTLKIGDSVIAGECYGKVRAMIDDQGNRIKSAGPSTPVEILGLSDVPDAGEQFLALQDERKVRNIAEKRQSARKQEEQKKQGSTKLEDIFKEMDSGVTKELNIVVKADVHGSVEALRQSLERLSTDEVKVKIIHGGVGAITETDIMLASASKAIIVGFNVRPDVKSRKASEREEVEIRLYRVIYELIDDVRMAMEGLLEPDIKEIVLGSVEVRAIFKVPKIGTIAGSYVLDGKITNNCQIRIIRDGVIVHEGEIESLRRFKDDVKEVAQGYECGIGIENFNDLKEGDIIESYQYEEVKRKL